MATIVIKDLPESIDLDRQAMTAITGGARMRGRQTYVGRVPSQMGRVVGFPNFRSFIAGMPASGSRHRT